VRPDTAARQSPGEPAEVAVEYAEPYPARGRLPRHVLKTSWTRADHLR